MHLLKSPCLRTLTSSASSNPLAVLRSSTSLLQSSQSYTTSPAQSPRRPCTSSKHIHRSYFSTTLPFIPTRHASTASEPAATAAEASLNWNEFLRLRRIRRFYNLGGSVVTGVSGVMIGASIMANNDIGMMGQQITGLDPFIIMGAWVLGFGGTGWLLGPVLGTTVFGMIYRRFSGQMRSKERDFFERIKKYRVDPTSSSMQNPVPDYYGEKITSVAGYRRWLKDQRAFNKKRQSFV